MMTDGITMTETPTKRPRGRPRKYATEEDYM